MPYAIEYESTSVHGTGEKRVGPILKKRIEKPLLPVITRNMTKKEAIQRCKKINNDPTFANAIHTVVKVNDKGEKIS